MFEKDIFYYHNDHLGSTSYISTMNGQLSQHVEYIPFGEVLFEEHSSSISMPYLFNGKELDRETNLTYSGARYLDMKTSLWLNIDPLAEKYPNISPYAYVANNPINAIDPDGRDIIFLTRNNDGSVKEQFKYRNGNFYHENGKRYNPGKEGVSKTMYKVLTAYRAIEKSNDNKLKNQLHTLEKSKNIHYMEEGSAGSGSSVSDYPSQLSGDDPTGTQTVWDLSSERKKELKESTGVEFTDLDIVTHEMRHQYDYDKGNMSDAHDDSSAKDPAEIRAVNNENRARKIEGNKMRTIYGGKEIDAKKLKNPPNND
ncbi:RHS repeat domain-containing protein [Flavobacterium columnare]|uniref:RHS repeat domain-containing protein n=1 Tax=Flavobacterium columnare TaxID=996 RepID=UPI001F0BA159|nr:RHS repeat-associated core domain-containing protein [Flavobacterium columnare]